MIEDDRRRLISDAFPDCKFFDEFSKEDQTAVVPDTSTIVQCKATGCLFEASGPGFFDASPLFQSAEEYPHFYFREVALERVTRWFMRRGRFRRTGRVWLPRSGQFHIKSTAKELAAVLVSGQCPNCLSRNVLGTVDYRDLRRSTMLEIRHCHACQHEWAWPATFGKRAADD